MGEVRNPCRIFARIPTEIDKAERITLRNILKH
jgi:hypothetical protein